jgi:carbon storage regulator CsrA
MLVLSRKPDEKLMIGADITIKVLSVRGGVVKLGIEAPPHVRILRGELPDWTAKQPAADHHPSGASEALAV